MLTMNNQITTQVMTITPAMAREWLENNPKNRKVTKHVVADYANAIRNGDWHLNGESIKVSQSGELLDGQHRLHAIIRANEAIASVVTMGLPDTVMTTVDVGKKRTTGDILSMDSVKYPAQVAGAVTLLFNMENGKSFAGRVSTIDARRFLEQHPEVSDSVLFTLNNKGSLKWRTQFAAAHYLFAQKDKEAADSFILRLCGGVGLSANEGVYRLREKLIMEDHNKKKSSRVDMFVWFVKAWNADRAGVSLTKLHGLGKDANSNSIPSVE